MNTGYKENQYFRQWWLWVILIGVGIMPIYKFYYKDEGTESNLIKFILTYSPFLLLFYFIKLKTFINKEFISVGFPPFYTKKVNWNEVESAEVIKYGFVGGYGIRIWTKYGTVYNTKGNKGLAIKLKNGDKFLIGTQKPEELQEFIGKLNLSNE